jgi:plastocyanin
VNPAGRPFRSLISVIAVVIAAGVLSSCAGNGGASTANKAPNTIVIKNFSFSTLIVAPGASVAVHNDDTATHTVAAVSPEPGPFKTGDIGPGKTATFAAPTRPGTYSYICMIHQFMHGTLIVR